MSFQNNGHTFGDLPVPLSDMDAAVSQMSESFQSPQIHNSVLQSIAQVGIDPSEFINEDTLMFPGVESPGGVVSPCSSPFEAMESDGLVDPEESIFSASGQPGRQIFPTAWNVQTVSTTTPGGSSDEELYASYGSRKRLRRTRRDVPGYKFSNHKYCYTSPSSQIPSPAPSAEALTNENDDSMVAFTNTLKRSPHAIANGSDSKLYNTILNANRRPSNASESSSCTGLVRDKNFHLNVDGMVNMNISSTPAGENSLNPSLGQSKKSPSARRRLHHHHHHHRSIPLGSAQSLQTQYPSSAHGYNLQILVQPETQHRARYLTEGSRGPVRDSSQQGYPKLQLKGYSGKTTLHIYVGSESDDRIRPHGFYQACKVTGRNTTQCEEVEVEGTKVIHIPFEGEEISVDCVGILKLRNADVEARIGLHRAKKRNQNVRLVFRVVLEDNPLPNGSGPCILQVVSNRINCTQPPGQPEITKKSLERCSVEGKAEMFIIGRNFVKGVKVIFQDSEEPDGTHWHVQAQIDKDTFHATHMVVRIPPYHDQDIVKSVNVQLYVEHNGRKCDPHSFTYDPSVKVSVKVEKDTTDVPEKVADVKKETVQALLEGLDRKYLEALFAKLQRPSDSESIEVKQTMQASDLVSLTTSYQLPIHPTFQQSSTNMPTQTVLYPSDTKPMPITMQNPALPISTSQTVIRPNKFGDNFVVTAAIREPRNFPCVQNPVPVTSQPQYSDINWSVTSCSTAMPNTLSTFPTGLSQEVFSQTQVSHPTISSVVSESTTTGNMAVKSELQTKAMWSSQPPNFLNLIPQADSTPGFSLNQAANSSGDSIQPPQGTNMAVTALNSHSAFSVLQPHLNTNQYPTQVENHVQLPQASTPVGDARLENPTAFGSQPESWAPQVVQAAPNLLGTNIIATLKTPTSNNVSTCTAAETILMHNANTAVSNVAFPSVNFTQHNPGSVTLQQANQQNLWRTLQHTATGTANIISSTSNQPTNGQVLWQSNEQLSQHAGQQTSMPVNPGGTSATPVQPIQNNSSIQSFVSNHTGSSRDPILPGQEEFFTLSTTVQMRNQNSTVDNATAASNTQRKNSFSPQMLLLSPTDVSSCGTPQPPETLNSPLMTADTGLSIGFDNNFSIHDSEILVSPRDLESSVLESIISDCTNSRSSFNVDDSVGHHIIQQQLQSSSHSNTEPIGTMQDVMFTAAQASVSEQTVQATLPFVRTSDIEMLHVPQMTNKVFIPQTQSLQIVQGSLSQDPNVYLEVAAGTQPAMQGQEMMTNITPNATQELYSISDSMATNADQNHLLTTQQNDQQSAIPNDMEARRRNDLQTIDRSVLDIGNENRGGL